MLNDTRIWKCSQTNQPSKGGVILTAVLFLLCHSSHGQPQIVKPDEAVIQTLDREAIFSFAIMSDNKGNSPSDDPGFARMVSWIEETEDAFVIGLGDHLKKGRANSFIPFVKNNPWWRTHFYPNVADGANEYFGTGQGDWGAGAAMLEMFETTRIPEVSINETGCEYHARIEVEGYTIHLIQLHFPDSPKNDSLSFRDSTKKYLEEKLLSIRKGPRDIVIVGAHSISGFWINNVGLELHQLIIEKCDLLLSATTHRWERKVLAEHPANAPLIVNTGSTSYPDSDSPGTHAGYIQVHILENPLRLVVTYLDVNLPRRALIGRGFSYTKVIGGPIKDTSD